MNRTQLFATAVTAALGLSVGAAAQAAVVGLTIPGAPNNPYQTDRWTDLADTGVDVGPAGASYAVGEVHTFHSQQRVGSFLTEGGPQPPCLNDPSSTCDSGSGFEITKEWTTQYTVTAVTPNTVIFQSLPGQTGTLRIFYDDITDGSAADPSGVSCYPGASCAYPEGVLILSATLLSSSLGITAITPTTGGGSFDTEWQITSVNPAFLDMSRLVGSIITDRFTGTLVVPPRPPIPFVMWDGTPVPAFNSPAASLFTVESSQTFNAPEPSSLALIGAGLLGLARLFRKKKV